MKILVAEDDAVSALVARRNLEQWGHSVAVVTDGHEAWKAAESGEFRLILSDWMMPKLSGPDLCRRIRQCWSGSYIYIILLTTLGRTGERLEGLNAGADDFLVKPADPGELLARINVAERILSMHEQLQRAHDVLETRVRERTDELVEANRTLALEIAERCRAQSDLQEKNVELNLAYDASIEGWSRALDLRDHETEGHSQRVTELTIALAGALGVHGGALVSIRRGALLHDIGKMAVPDHILRKPGPLEGEEWAVMRRHPDYAHEMLRSIDFLSDSLDIPRCHHEKWDGAGYPRGLSGEDIPLAARIFALADVWDALRSDRPYRSAWPAERAVEHIVAQSGIHFDPAVVKAFLAMRERPNSPFV